MLKDVVERALKSLHEEESTLLHRLELIRDGIDALDRLHVAYNLGDEQPAAPAVHPAPQLVVAPSAAPFASVAPAVLAQVETKPRVSVVPAAIEAAVPYIADASAAQPDVKLASCPAPAAVLSTPEPEGSLGNGDTVEKLTHDVGAWRPALRREKLEDIYRMLLLRKDRFSRDLPPTMDLSNPQVIRTLTNHLRHEAVPGYYQLCSRLKQHTHLSYLYRRARDVATGAIFSAYPELACSGNDDDVALQPSGAHHFAALAGMGSKATSPEAQNAA